MKSVGFTMALMVALFLISCKKEDKNPDSYIKVTFPSANISLMKCHTYTLKWESNTTDNVYIQLFKNNTMYKLLTTGTKNDGTFNWYIPNQDAYVGSDCFKIKVVNKVSGEVNSMSPAFSIVPDTSAYARRVVLIYPNGGEVWTNQRAYDLILEKNFEENVNLELFIGDVSSAILYDMPGDTITVGCYGFPVNSNYKVKVSSTLHPEVYDFSDEPFEINGNKSMKQ